MFNASRFFQSKGYLCSAKDLFERDYTAKLVAKG